MITIDRPQIRTFTVHILDSCNSFTHIAVFVDTLFSQKWEKGREEVVRYLSAAGKYKTIQYYHQADLIWTVTASRKLF